MNAQETVNNWLKEIGYNLKLDAKLDEAGICGLLFNNKTLVTIEVPPEAPFFYLYATLGALPEEMEKVFHLFTTALSLNLFQDVTEGASIGYSQELGELLLTIKQPIELYDLNKFTDFLTRFYSIAEQLREYFDTLQKGLAENSSIGG